MDEEPASRVLDLKTLSFVLNQCVVDVEKSVNRIDLSNIRLKLFGYCLAEDQVAIEIRPRILPALRTSESSENGEIHSSQTGARGFQRVTSDGSLVGHERKSSWSSIRHPTSIREIDSEILNSGAAIYPGCKDAENRPAIIFCCENELFTKKNKFKISKIISYFYHLTRESVRSQGLVLLVYSANGNNSIREARFVIRAIEAFVQEVLSAVYFVTGSTAKDISLLIFGLPPRIADKVVTIENIDELFKIFDRSQLPAEVGGSLVFNQKKWVDYRLAMESFMHDCYAASSYLIAAAEEMMWLNDLPKSVRETEIALVRHEEKIRSVFEDDLLLRLFSDGDSTLKGIEEAEEEFPGCRQLCESTESASELFGKVQSAVTRLEELATERQKKLEGCLQLRQYEDRASQVINDLCKEGEDLLAKYSTPGDNLRSAKLHSDEFNKAYTQFMETVAKGQDVIDDAGVFTGLGVCTEVIGVKEICRELKSCMTSFTSRVDSLKQTLENTLSCYQLLDKSFDWALKTMKFLVDLKLEKEMSLVEVQEARSNLEAFMAEHPPLLLEVFTHMEKQLPGLNNTRLSEQWLKAKGHYFEIDALMKQRHETLSQVLHQMKSHGSNAANRASSAKGSSVNGNLATAVYVNAGEIAPLTVAGIVGPKSPIRAVASFPVVHNVPNDDAGTGFWNQSASSLEEIQTDGSISFDSSILSCPVFAIGGRTDGLHIGLNTSVSSFAADHFPVQHSSLDVVIPPYVSYEPDFGSSFRPLQSNFSQSSTAVNYRTNSGVAPAPKVSGETRPVSQAFDVSEYMLKDSGSNMDSGVGEIRPWCSQSVLPVTTQEYVSHKPPSGPMYSSVSCLQNTRNGPFDKRHQSLPTSAAAGLRRSKPGIKGSFRKVLSSLTDAESNIRRRFLRKSSIDVSADMMSSSESLPGTLEDDFVPTANGTMLSNERTMHRKYGWSHIPSNSHLIYSNRLALASQSQSLMDVRLNEDEIQRNRVLSLILRELTMTESDYINSLDYIITNYIPELLSEDITQPLRGKKNVIFGNIEKIYEFHSQVFLAKLRKCQNSPFQLGACFLEHDSEFYLYALYNKNKPKADALMEEFGSKFFKKKQRDLNDRMDLNSYLLKPVQRMGKYALLLRQIIKECPESHPDHQDLLAALEMVKFQLRHGNDLLAMDSLRDCDVNLQEQGMLLRQHEFLVFHGRKKCLRQVFLFEELVVFSKTRRSTNHHDVYIYKNSIKTSDLGLTETVGESGCRFEIWFRKRTPGSTYVLQASLPDVKIQWVDDISRLLWKQTHRNRERRQVEMACMGMGSKPSLDLKQSKDNINDRYINFDSSDRNRAARPLKNPSIATAYDGRRPHSLISVSSLSSCGSSYSSGYGSCLSSGYGAAAGGMLSTTEESPLEDMTCEEVNTSQIAVGNNHSSAVAVGPLSANISSDDGVAMDMSAGASNDSVDVADLNFMVSEASKLKVSPALTREDACTQTTLPRPEKPSFLTVQAAPIASLESDYDEYY